MIELADSTIYVTYLHKKYGKFKPENININLNRKGINKPIAAFWGSPKDSLFGWKEWCECESMFLDEFKWNKPIFWRLKSNTKVLKINWEDIISPNTILKDYTVNLLENANSKDLRFLELDFNKILTSEIFAIELMDSRIGHSFDVGLNPYEFMFNSWDCESIVMLDKEKIEFLN